MTLPSPVMQWSFAGASGNTVRDLVSGAIMTIHDSPAFVSVESRAGLRFGPNHARNVTTNALPLQAEWTVALWVRREGSTRGASLFSGPTSALKLEQFAASSHLGITKFSYGGDSGWDETFGGQAPLDQWVHLTFVCANTGTTLYINRQRVGTLNNRTIPFEMAWVGSTRNGDEWAEMVLGEITVFNEALDDNQVGECGQGQLVVELGGAVTQREISSGESFNERGIWKGTALEAFNVTLKNSGTEELRIFSMSVSDRVNFAVSQVTATPELGLIPLPLPASLPPGQTLPAMVVFEQYSPKARSVLVTITTDDCRQQQFTFTLTIPAS